MKKSSRWGGIVACVIGVLLLGASLLNIADTISNPTSLPLIDTAGIIGSILNTVLAIFLIAIFIRSRQKSDTDVPAVKPEPDSLEDKEVLAHRRNWILGFVLIFFFISSSNGWVLNNYLAGATIVNIEVIFDLIFNLFFLYVIVQLFRNDKKVLPILFYSIIVYILVEAVMNTMRDNVLDTILGVSTAAYFIYAIKAPLNRKHFRIAHYVLLPALFIVIIVLNPIENIQINKTTKAEVQLEQQYTTLSENISSDYTIFLQKPDPTAENLQSIQEEVTQENEISKEMLADVAQLQVDYSKQMPNTDQVKTLDHLKKYVQLLNVEQLQTNTINSLMQYSESVDFKNLTAAQEQQIAKLELDIQAQQSQITTVDTIFNTP